jgi:hypothetical protein
MQHVALPLVLGALGSRLPEHLAHAGEALGGDALPEELEQRDLPQDPAARVEAGDEVVEHRQEPPA